MYILDGLNHVSVTENKNDNCIWYPTDLAGESRIIFTCESSYQWNGNLLSVIVLNAGPQHIEVMFKVFVLKTLLFLILHHCSIWHKSMFESLYQVHIYQFVTVFVHYFWRAHFCFCPNLGPGFPLSNVIVSFVLNDLSQRWRCNLWE